MCFFTCAPAMAHAQPAIESAPLNAPEGAESATEPPAPTSPPATTVPAPTGPDSAENDPVGALVRLVDAVRAGNWRLVASLALALLMLGLARVRDRVRWFKGDRGGAVLVGTLALGGALSTALAASAPLGWDLFLGTLGVMWTAVGGYTWLKRLIWPQDQKEPPPLEEPA